MSVEGIILRPGEARTVSLGGNQFTFMVTGEDAKGASAVEFRAAPGFDSGVHVHRSVEEIFYVVEGEFNLQVGDRVVRGGPGSAVFVPSGARHAISNPGSTPAKMVLIISPAGHERYFEELAKLLAKEGPPDMAAIAALRKQYDHEQLSPLTLGS